MTETQIRQTVVATAKKYLGCNEQNGSHRQFIERYNAFRPLPRNHRMTYTAAWCATFVSAVAMECGLTDIMPVECGCGYMISLYQKLGRWQEKDGYIPKAGDVIFYDWDDGADYASTDNTGRPEHVGIVTAADGGTVTVIEGNRNDAVAFRTVLVNGRYIRGYGLPDYAARATASAPRPKAKCPYAEPSKNIQFGAKGKNVKWLQWHLNQLGEKLSVDGLFGRLTKAAGLRVQRKHRLLPDGSAGPKTRAALKKAVK